MNREPTTTEVLRTLVVGTCVHCRKPVTEAEAWGVVGGAEMDGYPPRNPVEHLECKSDALCKEPT